MASKPKPAPQEAEDAVEGDQPAKKGLVGLLMSKKVLIIAAGALLLVGGGGGGYMMFAKGKAEQAAKAAAEKPKPVVFVDLPEVLVNLAATGNERSQYLKVKVVLELPDASLTSQIQTTMPRVMDAFQTYLRELRPTDLDGSAGLYRLKEELTRRVNAAIAPSRINAVLFKEIVVQ